MSTSRNHCIIHERSPARFAITQHNVIESWYGSWGNHLVMVMHYLRLSLNRFLNFFANAMRGTNLVKSGNWTHVPGSERTCRSEASPVAALLSPFAENPFTGVRKFKPGSEMFRCEFSVSDPGDEIASSGCSSCP